MPRPLTSIRSGENLSTSACRRVPRCSLLAIDLRLEFRRAPIVLERRRRGDEGVVVAAERAVVLARLPDIERALDQHDRERQAVAGDRLRHGHDVRLQAGGLEAEELVGAAAARLHIVDDEQDLSAAAERLQTRQPVEARGVQAAFALNELDDHRGRLVDAARRIGEHPVHVGDRVDLAAEIAVIRHHGDALERNTGRAAEMLVAGGGQRADGHAMKAVGEADDVRAAGDLARDFQRGFNGVGSRRAGELDRHSRGRAASGCSPPSPPGTTPWRR